MILAITWWPLEPSLAAVRSVGDRIAGVSPGIGLLSSPRELLLNVVLFVPLGAATGFRWGLVGAVTAGLLGSAAVECGQIMMTEHIISVADLASNTAGAAVGAAFPSMGGGLRDRAGGSVGAWFTGGMLAAAVVPALVIAGVGQIAYGSFHTWDDEYPLMIGNEVTGLRPWNGEIRELSLEAGSYSWTAGRLNLSGDEKSSRLPAGCAMMSGGEGIRCDSVGSGLTAGVASAGGFEMEAEFVPRSTDQKGPARILGLSGGHTSTNLTVGQSGPDIEIRLRRALGHGGGLQPYYRVADVLGSGEVVRLRIEASRLATRVSVNGAPRSHHVHTLPTQWWTLAGGAVSWRDPGFALRAVAAGAFFWMLLLPFMVSAGTAIGPPARETQAELLSIALAAVAGVAFGLWTGEERFLIGLAVAAVVPTHLTLLRRTGRRNG